MANPRELAQKAIGLLHDALQDSESRASELDAELKRKRTPRNRIEQRLEVVTHRLEGLEAESERWRRDAGQLEEVVANERAKIQQLKKKLEIAQSGPDHLTKKEVNFWRQRAEHFDTETREYKNRITNLRNELSTLGTAEDGPAADPIELETERHKLTENLEKVQSDNERLTRERDDLCTQLKAASDTGQKTDGAAVSDSNGKIAVLERKLASLEAALTDSHTLKDSINAELKRTHAELSDSRQIASEAQAANEQATQSASEHKRKIAALTADVSKTRSGLSSSAKKQQSLQIELDQASAAMRNQQAQLDESARRSKEQSAELDQVRVHKHRLEAELSELMNRSDGEETKNKELIDSIQSANQELASKDRQIEQLSSQQSHLEKERTEIVEQRTALEQESADAREQIAGLEAELKDEKECTENLSELANERKEGLTQIKEKLEEAQERYEEAKWQLGKAAHFERLIIRRKSLISSLIESMRAKTKANTALKAGLDGLRTFKASSQANQNKLLDRIDKLSAELKEAEENAQRHHGATLTQTELETSTTKITQLEDRLNTQAELIETLESDLKIAKAMQQKDNGKESEMQQLQEQLETKNEAIAKLEKDADEQQRKLAKLRGSESETLRLKTAVEKDKGLIDALEREVAQLREALTRNEEESGTAGEGSSSDLLDKLKERDSSIARLMGTVKEQEAAIAELTESVEKWRKKYDFVSAEPPPAYQSG